MIHVFCFCFRVQRLFVRLCDHNHLFDYNDYHIEETCNTVCGLEVFSSFIPSLKIVLALK